MNAEVESPTPVDVYPDVMELARQIAFRMGPDCLLDSADVGAMLKCGAHKVIREWVKAPGFPQAYRLTQAGTSSSHPRWKRGEIQAWIDGHANGASKRGGRPRKIRATD
jgi:hypothetical protein